ncbi:helix-turn-helix domain-containing protein [Methylobacterium radiotolerans]|uniref:helix-turn-helix domain-containing protein n=1 Tax=Methylobacterium radiotolerans TaxID=31998 RepID=UPI00097705B5|nr:hypothetical protein [Methylobacterium radiotolerans]ONF45542.1 hypothetical protein RSM1_29340 [Methylobacterium radiotolerans]
MAYHYEESGLENVYLENGYTIHQTTYGEGVSIQDTEGLHKAIGRCIVSEPNRISGAELRFLRLEMELTQRALAGLLGSAEQNVRNWEKVRKRPIPGAADRLLRALYTEYVDGRSDVRRMVDRLAELDCVEVENMRFRETDRGWQKKKTEERNVT